MSSATRRSAKSACAAWTASGSAFLLLVFGARPVDAEGQALALAGGDDQVGLDLLARFAVRAAPQHGVQHVVGDDGRPAPVLAHAGRRVESFDWFASVAVLDEGGYEIVRRDTTRKEHDITTASSINDLARDLTTWMAARSISTRQRVLRRLDQDLPRPRLCAAIVDRLTFNGTIIETGTDSYGLASTRARTEQPAAG